MVDARRAQAEDADELVRLRTVMLAMLRENAPEPGPWQETAVRRLRAAAAESAEPLAAFVVDKPDRPGSLAACAVGAIQYRLGTPENPTGATGYVSNVVTDPDYRRRGYSRACIAALLDWYQEQGVLKVDLLASHSGEPLYRELGFARTPEPAMRLTLS